MGITKYQDYESIETALAPYSKSKDLFVVMGIKSTDMCVSLTYDAGFLSVIKVEDLQTKESLIFDSAEALYMVHGLVVPQTIPYNNSSVTVYGHFFKLPPGVTGVPNPSLEFTDFEDSAHRVGFLTDRLNVMFSWGFHLVTYEKVSGMYVLGNINKFKSSGFFNGCIVSKDCQTRYEICDNFPFVYKWQ